MNTSFCIVALRLFLPWGTQEPVSTMESALPLARADSENDPSAAPALLPYSFITANDPNANVFFGESVALSGDTLILGTPHINRTHVGVRPGSAYVLIRDGDRWTQQAKLTAAGSDQHSNHFGSAVDVSGNLVVVGAPSDERPRDIGTSKAIVFVRHGSTWTREAKLWADDRAFGDRFGEALSLSGDTVLIGAPHADATGENSGAAYVFVRRKGEWNQQAKLLPEGAPDLRYFGRRVSLSGNTAIVGAESADGNEPRSGAAFVFVREGDGWRQQAKLQASDGRTHDHFGTSVDLCGETAVVGASFTHSPLPQSGSAYVFVREGESWIEQAKLIPGDPRKENQFGRTVAISGDTVVATMSFSDSQPGGRLGATYVFRREGTNWSRVAKLSEGVAALGDRFAGNADVCGETVVVSASEFGAVETGFAQQGAAYAFRVATGPWTDLGSGLPGKHGTPLLRGTGPLIGGDPLSLVLEQGRPSAQPLLFFGGGRTDLVSRGGILVPRPDSVFLLPPIDSSGSLRVATHWPEEFPRGTTLYLQAWIPDPSGPAGWTATNALSAIDVGPLEEQPRAKPSPTIELISCNSQGEQAGFDCHRPDLSESGRFVVFSSADRTLVDADNNESSDVFLRDRFLGLTERISVNAQGVEGDSWSESAMISRDGRIICFRSGSQNLLPVASDHNIFVYDRRLDRMELIPPRNVLTPFAATADAPVLSPSGRSVLFFSLADAGLPGDRGRGLYYYRRGSNRVIRVDTTSDGQPPNDYAQRPSITLDERYIAFESTATNLCPDIDNGRPHIFVKDLITGEVECISVGLDGEPANGSSFDPSMSDDGRFVAFQSDASNLVTAVDLNNTVPLTNNQHDIFVRDRVLGITRRISENAFGESGNKGSGQPGISADGRWVSFHSDSTNLTETNPAHWELFQYDLETGTLRTLTRGWVGGPINDHSSDSAVAPDGQSICFESSARNLFQGDINHRTDIVLWGPELSLHHRPTEPQVGDRVSFAAWGLPAGSPGLLIAEAKDGQPWNAVVARGEFNRRGRWTPSFEIPEALRGSTLEFRCVGVGRSGRATGSRLARIKVERE